MRSDDIVELRRPTGLPSVVREVAGEAASQLQSARHAARGLPRRLLPGTFAGLYLKRLERAGFDPYAAAVQDAPPGRIWRLTLSNLLVRF